MTTSSTRSRIHSGKRNAIKLIAGGVIAAAALGLMSACSQEEKPQFKSIDLTGADYAKAFSLTDQDGQMRSLTH